MEASTMTTLPVTIYSLTTCGWSRKAKAFFAERGIDPYTIEYDLAGPALRAKIDQEMHDADARGFPFVRIGGVAVNGYDPARFEHLLGRR
jgi:glutaredoxin